MKKLFTFFLCLASIAIAQAQIPNYVPTDQLGSWWSFTGNALDASGNGNHGSVLGAILTKDRKDQNDAAYSFNSSSIDFGGLPNLVFDSFSISFWIEPNAFQGERRVISKFIDSPGGRGGQPGWYGFEISQIDTTLFFFMADTRYHSYPLMFHTSLKKDIWNHLVYTIDPSNSTSNVYLNGVLVESDSAPLQFVNSGGSLIIGNDQFVGKLDDIGIWARALSSNEVQQLYSSPLSLGDRTEDRINVYPNPATDRININGLNGNNSNITLIDPFGSEFNVQLGMTGEGIQLDLTNHSPGVYWLRINDGYSSISRKILIQ